MEQPSRQPPLSPGHRKSLIVAGVVGLLCILAAVAALRRSPDRPSTAGRRVVVEADERPSPVAESIDPPPAKHSPAPVDRSPLPEERRARAGGDGNSNDRSTDWAVVAATFNDWDAAERRARSLKSQWSRCECKVYPPRGATGKFFVVLGMGLGRNDADRVRDEATASGMPSDTYVTKLARVEQ